MHPMRRQLVWPVLCGWLALPGAIAQTESPLEIHPWATNRVQLVWPPSPDFLVLQQTPGLDSDHAWEDVPDAPEVLGTLYSVRRDAVDGAAFYRLVRRGIPGEATPPNPASNAPPLVENVFNDLGSSTAFLYTGSNAVQRGVLPGTIAPARAAVIRGRAKRRDNSPLPGVRVAVLSHPEFGYTFTRQDGVFDLAVNAAFYTVDFQAIGYCPVQRQVEAPIQDFLTLPDVAMVPLDPVATTVRFGSEAPPQMAAGSPQTDEAGTRTTRVLIPAGTTASLVMADGSARPVEALTLRLTEFTVGRNGAAAMPAVLPPSSAYTFCAELSSDEAMRTGSRTVEFNQRVWGYVDNFLGLPVATLVPNGYYDRERAVWVPTASGIVMKILGVADGLAEVDLTGRGLPESPDALAANQFTTAELRLLAATYAPGQTVWRVPLAHPRETASRGLSAPGSSKFITQWTAVDWNYALGIIPPKTPNTPGDTPIRNPRDKVRGYGSVNRSSQVFEETVPLVGVPMGLHYSSARVPGYRAHAEEVIPVLDRPDPGILGVLVRTEIAGQSVEQELPPTTTTATVRWDGYDAYGRFVGGTRKGRLQIVLEVTPSYSLNFFRSPGCFGRSALAPRALLDNATAPGPMATMERCAVFDLPPLFTQFGQVAFAGGHGAGPGLDIGATFTRTFTIPDHRTVGLGGWSLTPHHAYDPSGRFLYLGTGEVRNQDRFANGFGPVPGLSSVPGLYIPLQVAAASDGTLYFQAYFLNTSWPRFFKLWPDGRYAFLSGRSGDPGIVHPYHVGYASVDGKSALLAAFNLASDMTVGPDGSLYFRERYASIGRIDPQGNLHLVLGDGPPVFPPDGTLARGAYSQPGSAGHLAVSRDGTVYYDDWWNTGCAGYSCGTNYIRKVAPDGRIYTVAGQAGSLWADDIFTPTTGWRSQLGLQASEAKLLQTQSLAVGPDGALYVSPNATGQYGVGGIFKITPDGRLEMVLSGPPLPGVGWAAGFGTGDEGTNATSVPYHHLGGGPLSLQATSDGSLVFYQSYGISSPSIWRITPGGTLQRLAGRGPDTSVSSPLPASHLGANPLAVTLPTVAGEGMNFAVGPDGSLTLGGSSTSPNAYRISASASGFTGQELQVPAADATELYVFDAHGLHLRTLDALTGATNWTFTYDAHNLLIGLRDGDGLTTTVQRDAAGRPTAIVGPYGQRTALALDPQGFLASVTNPANEVTRLAHGVDGLLVSIAGPLNHTYTMAYDARGLLTRAQDPRGGSLALQVTDSGTQVLATSTSALGEVEQRSLVLETSGDTTRTNYFADHTWESGKLAPGGTESFAHSSGIQGYLEPVGDPRFPTGTALPALGELRLPGGPVSRATQTYSASLTDPGDPFSVTALTHKTTLNGRTRVSSYDATNRVWRTTTPEGRQTAAWLDAQGRLIRTEAMGRTRLDLGYDDQGRLAEVTEVASAGPGRTSLRYDGLGQLQSVTDPLGRTRQYAYDAAGRLRETTLADGQVVAFGSDAEGRLTAVTPPGRPAHRYEYDAVGLVTNYVPPVVNGVPEAVEYAYDADRRLVRVSWADGQEIRFQRGPGGRIDELGLGAGPTWTYAYAPENGLPTHIVSSTGEGLSLNYRGFLVTHTAWSGSITGSVDLAWNQNFVPVSQSINGSAVAFAYDADLLITRAGDLAVNRDRATGWVVGTQLGLVTDQRQFDDRGLLTQYQARVSGTAFWSVVLSHDLAGRLTNRVETAAGITRTVDYGYDAVGRLETVRRNGVLTTTYTYDANGNRMTRNAEAATYDEQDRVQTYAGARFEWSPQGTLRSRTSGGQLTTYHYDLRGALTAVIPPAAPRIDYFHDAAGRRLGKKVGGVLQRGWLWDEDRPVAEVDANSAVISRFVYGADDTTPSYLVQGTHTFRLLTDERGSVRFVVNVDDGTVAQELDYDEFGRVLVDTAAGFQPFGYAGGLYEPETGLVRFGERDYSAETGQWTARDPVEFDAGQLSLYAYVGNDPVNWVDPSGLGPFPAPKRSRRMVPADAIDWTNADYDTVAKVTVLRGAPAGTDALPPRIWVRRERATDWHEGYLGQELRLGDEIKTSENTYAAIQFVIGGRAGINRDSSVRITSERSVGDSQFNVKRVILRKGSLLDRVERQMAPLEITPSGGLLGGQNG